MFETTQSAYQVGAQLLIRTATVYDTGRIVAVFPHELVLEDACWIPDTGRFSNSLKSCDFNEVEPFHNPVIVNRGGIIDATYIDTLPTTQK